MLCRFATVNDVHFGETECGRIDDHPLGPILRREPGERPYPEVMNAGAVGEIADIDPAAVIVKGDLSNDGNDDEWAAFEDCYRTAFGARLHVVRGNHDAHRGQTAYAGDQWIELPGLAIGLLDTTIPHARRAPCDRNRSSGWTITLRLPVARCCSATISSGCPVPTVRSDAATTTSACIPTRAMRSMRCAPATTT